MTSVLVQDEIEPAPPNVQECFGGIIEFAEITDEALRLQEAYLEAEIVTSKWALDALHVAIATVARCSLIVSWNFKHIVHFEKIALYNAVNTLEGYSGLAIHSPQEVIDYEDEDV